MPGNGNHDNQRGDESLGGKIPLGNKVKEELLSALRLLFKSAEEQAVVLSFQPDTTIYMTEIPAEAVMVPLAAPAVTVSEDPIRILAERGIQSQALTLLTEAELAPGAPCHLEPALCSEPIFDDMAFTSAGISFENMEVGPSYTWPVTPLVAKAQGQPIEALSQPASKAVSATFGEVKSKSALNLLAAVKARQHPRFLTLPIRKVSIPAHRFTLAQRERFRKALAEKAGTHPANIQLKVVFGRMHMPLYASIQPDDQGNLLCTPKAELLGKPMNLPANKALLAVSNRDMTYLVIGTRLDTKADVRALVPMEAIHNPNTEEGGDTTP